MIGDGGSGPGGRSCTMYERKVRTPKGKVLGNAQAEQSDTSATEKIPPMAEASASVR